MKRDTHARLEGLLGRRVARAGATGGGDIASAFAVDLVDGGRVFVKDYGDEPVEIVRAEARGLAWLAEADVIDVPRVVAVADDAPLLALEWIETGPRPADFDADLGRRLAALHESGAPSFGRTAPGYIGPIPLSTETSSSWPAFYAESCLRPLLRRARDAGVLGPAVIREADTLIETLPARSGPPEPPARLHGDLWSGNLMVGASGRPVLVDPSAHGGHRETDLAMMRLFGGFAPRVFDAYAEHAPLSPDAAERVPIHQLYPLLVHALLFGGAYATEFARTLRACG